MYDAHGNDVASLSRDGSGGFHLGDRRSYDAWGVVRAQQSGGDPKLRYCASLGHVQDDETGLVYMRARYYEPTSGRFLSEDPAMSGQNWFAYCGDDPVNSFDGSGKFHTNGDELTYKYDFFMGAGLLSMMVATACAIAKKTGWCIVALESAAAAFVGALGCTDISTKGTANIDLVEYLTVGLGFSLLTEVAAGLEASGKFALTAVVGTSIAAYSTMLVAGLFWCYEGEGPDDGD